MSPMEALNKVAKESNQSPLDILNIMGSPSEISAYRNDLEQRIEGYIKWGISPVEACTKVARDIGISIEVVERIITQYPVGKNYLWEEINKYKNKLRYLVANILILIGMLILCNPEVVTINRYRIGVNKPLHFSIGIILLINGAIILIKSTINYLKKK
jgi:hypothetical protein